MTATFTVGQRVRISSDYAAHAQNAFGVPGTIEQVIPDGAGVNDPRGPLYHIALDDRHRGWLRLGVARCYADELEAAQ